MNWKRITLYIILAIIILIQFIPAGRPELGTSHENDLLYNNEIPEDIAGMLRASCYDCHSYEVNYPWYSYVAPVSWLVARDIREGLKELNFSEWESQSKMDKAKNLDEIIDEITEGEMPMPIYTIIHRNAKLTDEQKEQLADWADSYAESLFE
jgi:hypothetical protein